ncbi:hypothetical protein [Proteus sp. FME41]|uniref:hypothetical protein n=1 Tax=Proteus sp. FME41 TaxID=2742608 RepID=UPI001866AD33|nr:hypothetical protein [Proteus sp. FME41]
MLGHVTIESHVNNSPNTINNIDNALCSKFNSLCEKIYNTNNIYSQEVKSNDKLLSQNEIESKFNHLISIIDNSVNFSNQVYIESLTVNNVTNENINSKPINKLDENIAENLTELGKKKLNVNEEINFKINKKHSLKNLISLFISPFKYISRMTININVNIINQELSKELNEFNFSDKVKGNKDVKCFLERFEQLNKTFFINIDKVNKKIKKSAERNSADKLIKYSTLEKALECKFINDIKKLKNELINDFIKSKFISIYPELSKKINSCLDKTLYKSANSSDVNVLFSSESINNLTSVLKEVINDGNNGIYFDDIILKAVKSVINEEDKEKIINNERNDINYIKSEISLDIIKGLFNNLINNEKFIDENESLSKVNILIMKFHNHIFKNIGKLDNKINKNFYENIKKSDEGNNLLTRLFRNSSNNINYKWAQDAVVLLINYETFSNENRDIKKYISNGVANNGGIGSKVKESSELEEKLKNIFNRLGLDGNNLEGSKDEVLRKYFANYFEHV